MWRKIKSNPNDKYNILNMNRNNKTFFPKKLRVLRRVIGANQYFFYYIRS